ncbi:MAG: hypothetical protein ACFFEJ_10410 [Candidatus Thorarchaeota archaeon]
MRTTDIPAKTPTRKSVIGSGGKKWLTSIDMATKSNPNGRKYFGFLIIIGIM